MQEEGLSGLVAEASWVIADINHNRLAQRTLRQFAVGVSKVMIENFKELVANVCTRLGGAVHDAKMSGFLTSIASAENCQILLRKEVFEFASVVVACGLVDDAHESNTTNIATAAHVTTYEMVSISDNALYAGVLTVLRSNVSLSPDSVVIVRDSVAPLLPIEEAGT